MPLDYRESHLAPGKGQRYHKCFLENPYRSMVWRFEKRILDRIVAGFLSNCKIRHFDFACGTGRILGHLEKRTNVSVGVDLSPSMLEVARQHLQHSQLIEADLTERDVLEHRSFNLITAFRFFPNAQSQLRREAIQVIARHLDRGGYFVFNNHKNLSSLTYRLARAFDRGGRDGMAMAEVEELVRGEGMQIVRIYHLGVLPAYERRKWLPISVLQPLEFACSLCPLLRSLGQNLIFVCKRDKEYCCDR